MELNRVTPRIYVAATRQDDGKTTCCLGLYAALSSKYKKIGYIKPVGQRFVEVGGRKVDEDSVLVQWIECSRGSIWSGEICLR